MDTQILESTIVEMASMLEMRKGNHPTVLFLGAKAGGLFRGRKLYEIVSKFGNPSFSSLPVIEQFRECFKVLSYERFGETEINTILIESLRNQSFSTADACLADLVKEGLFDVIISTNIDDLLERALNSVNLWDPYDFYVRIPKRGVYTGSKNTLIKVFGDLTSQEYRMKDEFYLNRDKDFKKDLESYLGRDILMIGFDPIWDREIDDIYPFEGKSLWYVDEEPPADNSRISRALHRRQGSRYIRGSPGTYDSFVQELHNCIIGKGPLSHELVREMFNQLQEIREIAVQLRDDILHLQASVQELRTTRGES